MRNPINLLSSLQTHSNDRSYTFERLYRNLYNRELFMLAYQNIYASQGNMTQGTDGKTIDAMSLSRIDGIIASLKDESYQPQPSRRTYIPKKNGKMRPLGIPSFDDKLVQECVRLQPHRPVRRSKPAMRSRAGTPPLRAAICITP